MNLNHSVYNRRALYAGVIASFIVGFDAFVLGNISGYEAKILLKSSLPVIDILPNTIVHSAQHYCAIPGHYSCFITHPVECEYSFGIAAQR